MSARPVHLAIFAPSRVDFDRVRESLERHAHPATSEGSASVLVMLEDDPTTTATGFVLCPGPFVEYWVEVIYDMAAGMWLEESNVWD